MRKPCIVRRRRRGGAAWRRGDRRKPCSMPRPCPTHAPQLPRRHAIRAANRPCSAQRWRSRRPNRRQNRAQNRHSIYRLVPFLRIIAALSYILAAFAVLGDRLQSYWRRGGVAICAARRAPRPSSALRGAAGRGASPARGGGWGWGSMLRAWGRGRAVGGRGWRSRRRATVTHPPGGRTNAHRTRPRLGTPI